MASESMVSRMSVPESCERRQGAAVKFGRNQKQTRVEQEIIMQRLGAYRLVGLEGGLELHVVPVSQDVAEGRLVGAKLTFSCLADTTTAFSFDDFCNTSVNRK